MTNPQICKCDKCGTPHIVLANPEELKAGVAIANGRGERLEVLNQCRCKNPNLPCMSSDCRCDIHNCRTEGYDTTKCIEPVSKDGWITEQQCTRARGFGKDKAYCKQHSKLHPEEANKS